MITVFERHGPTPEFKVEGVSQYITTIRRGDKMVRYAFPDPTQLTEVGLRAVRARDMNDKSLLSAGILETYSGLARRLFLVIEQLKQAEAAAKDAGSTPPDVRNRTCESHIREANMHLQDAYRFFRSNSQTRR